MKDKKLIAFDLYDTCFSFDTSKESTSDAEFFSGLGISHIQHELRKILMTSHRSIEDVLSNLLPKYDMHVQLEQYYRDVSKKISSVQLFPETESTLMALHQRWYKIAAVSNLSQSYIEPLRVLLPHIFDYEVLSCDVGITKPDPRIFDCLKNISWYGSDGIVMVGDSIFSDVQWAKNAGITPIHIQRNLTSAKKPVEYIQISSLSELLDIFKGV